MGICQGNARDGVSGFGHESGLASWEWALQ